MPAYTGAISFITAALEENERDELIRYKKLKKRMREKAAGSAASRE
ncbi:MAG: V-type ATP synthase subunit D [Spirochaetota bacterium]